MSCNTNYIAAIYSQLAEMRQCLKTLAGNSNLEASENITSAGTGSVPAGFKSISIVKLSANTDTVSITLADGSVYEMTEQGEVFADSSTGITRLPAYTISGGTVKWHGIK